MEEYKSNSHRSKEEKKQAPDRKKTQAVAKAKVKKKSSVRKFTETFVSEDVSSVKDYIIGDFIIPLIQKTICDIFEEIPKTIFYGKSSKGRRSSSDREFLIEVIRTEIEDIEIVMNLEEAALILMILYLIPEEKLRKCYP